MVSTVTVNNVYRDYITNGVPGSGNHEPDKADIRALLSRLETIAGIGAVAVATKAELDAITDKDDATPGFVWGDGTATNNGQYAWDDSGSAWVKLRALPDTAAVLQSVSGTNTITASVGTGVDPAVVALFILVAAATNAGAVTLNISGSGAQDLVDRNGDALIAGSLVSGRAYLVFDDGSDYRLLNDDDRILPFQGAYAGGTTYELGDLVESGGSIWYSLQDGNTGNTPTEGAYWTQFLPGASVADGSITVAKMNSVALNIIEGFETVSDLLADTDLTYTASQDGSVVAGDIIKAQGFRYEVAASGASDHDLTTAGGVRLYVLKNDGGAYHIDQWNPNADGSTDDYALITAAIAKAGSSAPLILGRASYAASATLDFTSVKVLVCDETIIVPTHDGTAVQWVGTSGSLIERFRQLGNLRVEWASRDWTTVRRAFYIKNAYNCEFHLGWRYATVGLLMEGDETGCVHNDVYLSECFAHMVGVWLNSASATGWCNSNRFHGGFFYGAATSGEVSAGLHSSQCGHIQIDNTPYANNGNIFNYPSLEWVGPDHRLARMSGIRNILKPKYCEADSGTTWIVDTGTNNFFDCEAVPYLAGYDPADTPPYRLDLSGATGPVAIGPSSYRDTGLNFSQICKNNGTRPTILAENEGSGPVVAARISASNINGFEVQSAAGTVGVGIPYYGDWTVNAGLNKLGWSGAAPTSGTYAAGDFIRNTVPSETGTSPNKYVIIGWICESGGSPGTWRECRCLTGA